MKNRIDIDKTTILHHIMITPSELKDAPVLKKQGTAASLPNKKINTY